MSHESNWEEELKNTDDLKSWMDVQKRAFDFHQGSNKEAWLKMDIEFEKLKEYLQAQKDKQWAEYQRNNPSPTSLNSSSSSSSSGSTSRRRPPPEEPIPEVQNVTTQCKCGMQYEFELRQDADRRYSCPRCENTFKTVSNLEKHLKIGTKSCECDCSDNNNN